RVGDAGGQAAGAEEGRAEVEVAFRVQIYRQGRADYGSASDYFRHGAVRHGRARPEYGLRVDRARAGVWRQGEICRRWRSAQGSRRAEDAADTAVPAAVRIPAVGRCGGDR